MSFDHNDPQDVGAVINAFQGNKQINLQQQILEMQKLQVLNQIRISEGLKPLAELPPPPPPPPPPPEPKVTFKDVVIALIGAIIIIGAIVAFVPR